MEQTFLEIFEQENFDALMPFLKGLDDGNRKKLGKLAAKEADKRQNSSQYSKTSENKYTILSVVLFVCLDYNQYKRYRITLSYMGDGFVAFNDWHQKKIMEKLTIDDILEWYVPVWFESYLNNPRDNEQFKRASYVDIMRWYDQKYIQTLSPELIAVTLSKIPFSCEYTKDWKTIGYYKPEVVLQHPLTVREHIWTLFQIPTNICYQEIGMKDDQNWMHIFKWLIEEGTVKLIRVLKEILSALVNASFNKTQLIWFGDFFKFLEPTEDEILTVQSELFGAIYTPQSKPLSMIIDYLKQICLHKDFLIEEFYISLPVLLSSNTKSILKGGISLAEILLKNKQGDALQICQALCQGFLTSDEAIQKQITKIITKYNKPEDLAETVNNYSESVLSTVRPLLGDFIASKKKQEHIPEKEAEPVRIVKHISEETKIPEITGWDDFVFYAPQVFENKEPCHFYLLPACILRFDKEMNEERAIQLLPFFKKAVKTAGGWESLFICNILAPFVVSYGKLLVDRYPAISNQFEDIINFDVDIVNAVKSLKKKLNVVNSVYQQGHYLIYIIEAIRKNEAINLVSIPTHTPAWIEPRVLIERLCDAGESIWDTDLEMALQKCCLQDTGEALKKVQHLPDGELKELMLFLLDETKTFEPSTVKHHNWWVTAYLTKYPNIVPPADIKTMLGLEAIPDELLSGELKWHFDELLRLDDYTWPYQGDEDVKFIAEYDYFSRQGKNYFQEYRDEDISYFICNNPYNHSIALMKGLRLIYNYKSPLNASDRKILSSGLQTVQALNLPYTKVDYLFLAFSICSSDKQIKDLALEIWMSGALLTNIDSKQFGEAFATMVNRSHLPLSRFTDVVMSQIQYNSQTRNKIVEEMLSASLIHLEQVPKDLKKLLLLYQEIVSLTNSKPSDTVCQKLQEWAAIPSVKKICNELIKITV